MAAHLVSSQGVCLLPYALDKHKYDLCVQNVIWWGTVPKLAERKRKNFSLLFCSGHVIQTSYLASRDSLICKNWHRARKSLGSFQIRISYSTNSTHSLYTSTKLKASCFCNATKLKLKNCILANFPLKCWKKI
jgi:hypothetical protein